MLSAVKIVLVIGIRNDKLKHPLEVPQQKKGKKINKIKSEEKPQEKEWMVDKTKSDIHLNFILCSNHSFAQRWSLAESDLGKMQIE